MTGRTILSFLIVTIAIIVAIVCYVLLFINMSHFFWNFSAIFYFSLITFGLAFFIFIGAMLLERRV